MSISTRLQEMAKRREKAATAKANKQLRTAKSQLAGEKVKTELATEKLHIRQKLAEAQIATAKAEKAMQDARRQAGHLTIDERLSRTTASIGKSIAGGVKAYRSVAGTSKSRKKSGKSGQSLEKFIWG